MQPTTQQQRDLFKEDRTPPEMPAPLRKLVFDLITGLLAEAIAGSSEGYVTTARTTEAADEQDHA